MDQPVAFLVTPFSATAAGGEDPDLYARVQNAIHEGAQAAGVELKAANDIFKAGVVIEQVRGAIETADVIIGVCTGRNANVFYELGIAEVREHKPILIAATKDDLPFDMAHWRAHMYGETDPITTLGERVRKAIVETLAERDEDTETRTVPASAPRVFATAASDDATTASTQAGPTVFGVDLSIPLRVVQESDWITFNEATRRLAHDAGAEASRVATENLGRQPSEVAVSEAKEFRFETVERLLEWCIPAIEYEPDWLRNILRETADWFRYRIEGSAFQFWTDYQTAWTSLFLRAALAVALRVRSGVAVERLLELPGPTDRSDSSPLVINTTFTFVGGYAGSSRTAFDDFVEYAQWSKALSSISGIGVGGVDLACGGDLLRGIARSAWESSLGGQPSDSAPHIYAGFALHPCRSISWAATTIEHDDHVGSMYGYTPAQVRQIARDWYPSLARRVEHKLGWFSGTCDTWDEALAGHW